MCREKTTVNVTYAGIICWTISLHHLSLSIYKKLLRNKDLIISTIIDFHACGNTHFTDDASVTRTMVTILTYYLSEVPLDVTVEK